MSCLTVKNYLIKRNPSFSNSGYILRKNDKRKIYAEIWIGKEPFKNLKIDDMIYVSQKNIGIYASGKIINITRPKVPFENISQALDFCNGTTDNLWWLDKLIKYNSKLKSNPNLKLYYLEYEIDQKLLTKTIPLDGMLLRLNKSQSSITEINSHELQFICNPIRVKSNNLNANIPMSLKMDLYSFFNKNYSISHWKDIDHFVPKSAGGPGNIIENLVPIGFNINRYKSDSIPKSFFEYANNFREFRKLIKNEWLIEKEEFIRKKHNKDAKISCEKINFIIANSWDFEKAKSFYREVLRLFNPSYVKLIEDFANK